MTAVCSHGCRLRHRTYQSQMQAIVGVREGPVVRVGITVIGAPVVAVVVEPYLVDSDVGVCRGRNHYCPGSVVDLAGRTD